MHAHVRQKSDSLHLSLSLSLSLSRSLALALARALFFFSAINAKFYQVCHNMYCCRLGAPGGGAGGWAAAHAPNESEPPMPVPLDPAAARAAASRRCPFFPGPESGVVRPETPGTSLLSHSFRPHTTGRGVAARQQGRLHVESWTAEVMEEEAMVGAAWRVPPAISLFLVRHAVIFFGAGRGGGGGTWRMIAARPWLGRGSWRTGRRHRSTCPACGHPAAAQQASETPGTYIVQPFSQKMHWHGRRGRRRGARRRKRRSV